MSQTCPDVGLLRALLDTPIIAGTAPGGVADHVAACAPCEARLVELRTTANTCGAAFEMLATVPVPSPAETAQALTRTLQHERTLRAAAPRPLPVPLHPISLPTATKEGPPPLIQTASAPPPRRPLLGLSSSHWRIAFGGLAAGLIVSVGFLTAGGQALASQFLSQFRTVTIVPVDASSQQAFAQLANLGTVKSSGTGRAAAPSAPVSLSDASGQVGFTLEVPKTLPTGVPNTPTVRVMASSDQQFTFDTTKAQTYFRSAGYPEASLPPQLNGVSLVLQVPPIAMLQYADASAAAPTTGGQDTGKGFASSGAAVMVVEASAPSLQVDGGLTLDQVRDALTGLPGLPSAVQQGLNAVPSWNNVLPIPVPVDKVHWQQATFQGASGLLLNDNSGLGSAAVWERDGHVFGVVGPLKAADLQNVANSLS